MGREVRVRTEAAVRTTSPAKAAAAAPLDLGSAATLRAIALPGASASSGGWRARSNSTLERQSRA
jgi:hypothetical protein